jgi:DNA-binding IclR family transcriptional regulator
VSQSAGRALDLLVAVVGSSKTRGLMELAEQTAIDKSTAARLLNLLVERHLISRDEETQRYDTGSQMYSLFASIGSQIDVRAIAAPHLATLRDLSGQTASLHILVGKHRVCIDGKESNEPVRRVVPIGETIPLYQGPSSKVILAFLSDSEISAIFKEARTAGVDTKVLSDQLADVRRVGYALTESDRTRGVRAISAPVFGPRGPVASITVAGPTERWTLEAAEEVVPSLLDIAQTISFALGGGAR